MKTPLPILSVFLTLAVWQYTPPLALGQELADGEREFVHQLLDRQLFELAEQFCGEKLKSASDAGERAEWELLLATCHLHHAWWMNDDSRNGMIALAAQRITEFLRSNTPSSEKDILLRVRQIELLAASGNMEVVVCGGRSGLANWKAVPGMKPRRISATTRFALDAIDQGSELAESLLKQIDQIRRDVDSDVVRIAREQIRLSQAQMYLVRSRFSSDKDAVALRDQAGLLAEQLLKSTNDADLRFSARLLLAEIQLDRNDFAAFDLRFTSLLSAASTDASLASAAALKIKALLQQNQPSDALQECVNYSRDGLSATPELLMLRLQALLQMLELLYQLDESPQRDELIAKSSAEFVTCRETTLAVTRGVWRDRCLRIATRFARVQQVGPEAASSLEEIAALVDDGDLQAARAALLVLSRQTGAKENRLAAIYLLQSGDLAIRLRDWDSASTDLETAIKLFHQYRDDARAAAADLLRIYAIGQQWNADPAIDIAEQNYRMALNDHIGTYAGQPTVIQAREWRARLMRTVDPLESAEELLHILESADSAKGNEANGSSTSKISTPVAKIDHRLDLLCLAGDLLLEAMVREPMVTTSSSASDRLNTAAVRFGTQSMAVRNSQEAQGRPALIVLEAQQLGLSLRNRLSTATDWNAIEADSRRLLSALSGELLGISGLEESPVVQKEPVQGEQINGPVNANNKAIARRSAVICQAMVVLASVRQLHDAADFESSRTALTTLAYEDRLRTVQQLMRQLPISEERVPGDPQLAHLLIGMITNRSGDIEGGGAIERQIAELSILDRLCAVAGDRTAAEDRLNTLIMAPLTDSQTAQVADIVSRSATSSGHEASAASAGRFWQSVQKRTKPGQDAWFEASLQMAAFANSNGNRKEASRILGVVNVLHPEWGNPSRKARAVELQEQMESSR